MFISNLIFAQTLKLTAVVTVAVKALGSESSSFPKPAGINNKVDELNYIQRNRSYGLQTKMIDKEKKPFKLSFVSYKSKDFYQI